MGLFCLHFSFIKADLGIEHHACFLHLLLSLGPPPQLRHIKLLSSWRLLNQNWGQNVFDAFSSRCSPTAQCSLSISYWASMFPRLSSKLLMGLGWWSPNMGYVRSGLKVWTACNWVALLDHQNSWSSNPEWGFWVCSSYSEGCQWSASRQLVAAQGPDNMFWWSSETLVKKKPNAIIFKIKLMDLYTYI